MPEVIYPKRLSADSENSGAGGLDAKSSPVQEIFTREGGRLTPGELSALAMLTADAIITDNAGLLREIWEESSRNQAHFSRATRGELQGIIRVAGWALQRHVGEIDNVEFELLNLATSPMTEVEEETPLMRRLERQGLLGVRRFAGKTWISPTPRGEVARSRFAAKVSDQEQS